MDARPTVRRLLFGLVATVALAGPPTADPARAVEAVPGETVAFAAPPGGTLAALVGDVDGDGVRELVRIMTWGDNPDLQAVAVTAIRSGRPAAAGQAPLRRGVSPEDAQLPGRPA
ncbi:MAG: hypothetical protein ACRDHD_04200, partial [Candidatus Limnocylindria bacterium]